MNKKWIFGIVLFLLLAFITYSFASPSNKRLGDGNTTGSITDGNVLPEIKGPGTIININNVPNPTVSNPEKPKEDTTIPEDNRLKDATLLVEKAEKTLTQKDVDTALESVKLLDPSPEKDDLIKRLDEVQKEIDRQKLLDELKKLIDSLNEKEEDYTTGSFKELTNEVNKVTDENHKIKEETLTNQDIIDAIKNITDSRESLVELKLLNVLLSNEYKTYFRNEIQEELTLKAIYNDELRNGEVTPTIKGTFNTETLVNNAKLIYSFKDKTATYTYDVIRSSSDKKLISIKVKLDKTTYNKFDEIGKYTVTATEKDGTTYDVTDSTVVTGFNTDTSGKKNMTFTYTKGNKQTASSTINYNVLRSESDKKLISLKVNLVKREYNKFDEIGKYTVTATEKDGTTYDVTDSTVVTGFNTDTSGKKNMTFTYTKGNNQTASSTINYNVVENSLMNLEVYMTSYTFEFGSDIGAITAFATKKDGSRNDVTKDIKIENFDTFTEGTRTMTISYTDSNNETVSSHIKYTVLPFKQLSKLVGIKVELEQRTYKVGTKIGEMKVYAMDNENRIEDVTSLVKITGFSTNTSGHFNMTITYTKNNNEVVQAIINYNVF